MPHYRALPPTDFAPPLRLDQFLLVYHRASGQTHMLAEPAPEILAVLDQGGEGDATIIAARLADQFDGVDEAVVAARLEELAALGLIDET